MELLNSPCNLFSPLSVLSWEDTTNLHSYSGQKTRSFHRFTLCLSTLTFNLSSSPLCSISISSSLLLALSKNHLPLFWARATVAQWRALHLLFPLSHWDDVWKIEIRSCDAHVISALPPLHLFHHGAPDSLAPATLGFLLIPTFYCSSETSPWEQLVAESFSSFISSPKCDPLREAFHDYFMFWRSESPPFTPSIQTQWDTCFISVLALIRGDSLPIYLLKNVYLFFHVQSPSKNAYRDAFSTV